MYYRSNFRLFWEKAIILLRHSYNGWQAPEAQALTWTLPQNPSNNKGFSMALSPWGKFSMSLSVITSFPNFRYQSTQKNYAFIWFVKGKRKISPGESKWNSGILSFGIKQNHAVCLAPQEEQTTSWFSMILQTFGFPEILWIISSLSLPLSSHYYSRWQSQWLASLKKQTLNQLQQILNVIVLHF